LLPDDGDHGLAQGFVSRKKYFRNGSQGRVSVTSLAFRPDGRSPIRSSFLPFPLTSKSGFSLGNLEEKLPLSKENL